MGTKKMKVFAGLVASALAAPAPVIIGGKNASDGQFPHQVTLKRSSGSHYCGGSIINTNKVMCAAHCRQSTNSWTAGAGSVNISGQRQNKSGSAQLPHPQYNANTIDYDYMILTIQGSWSYDTHVNRLVMDILNISEVTQVLSLQPFNGWILVASPSLNARKSGDSKPSLLDNNVPPPMVSPPAWVTLAAH